MFSHRLKVFILLLISICAFQPVHGTVTANSYASSPPLLTDVSSAFVMINLSVEAPQLGEAYTDGEQTYVGNQTYCPGRVKRLKIGKGKSNFRIPDDTGICYHNEEIYIGYFDPKKCYVYDTSGSNRNTRQVPTSPSTDASSSDHPDPHYFRPVTKVKNGHKCSGNQFSGNFMNWASMAAIDQFRYATTGGARLVDTAGSNAQTLLTRANRTAWKFVNKAISSTGLTNNGVTFTNKPGDVTPHNESSLVVEGHKAGGKGYNGQEFNTVSFYTVKNGRRVNLGTYNVIVEVCNPSQGLEPNCNQYTDGSDTWYKPEGVLLENSLNIRYALMTYTAKSGRGPDPVNGGVLRAQAKHIGYLRPLDNGGLEANPEGEIDAMGRMVFDPDNALSQSGVNNSGLMNYINNFGLRGYKSRDPIGELFYEGLRYIRGLQPTPEYIGQSNRAPYNITRFSDRNKDNFPIIERWEDPIQNQCQKTFMVSFGDQFSWSDANLPGNSLGEREPSVPDNFFNVTESTNKVGSLENYTGNESALALVDRGLDKNNFYIAGMAYRANTEDLRPDIPGMQSVKTFMVDTQEFKEDAPQKQENQLWLTAKYGGFEDLNGDGDPNNGTPRARTDEWDADGDGDPDAYTLASQPANLIKGLRTALNEVAESVNASSAVGAVSNTITGQSLLVQALYKPKHTSQNGDVVEWTGVVHALFLDEFGRFREDKPIGNTFKGDGRITDKDPVIKFVSSPSGDTSVSRFRARGNFTESTPYESGVSLEKLNTVWNVRDELATLTDLKNNRVYSEEIGPGDDKGRYIFTFIDKDGDDIVSNGESTAFTADLFEPNTPTGAINAPFLGLPLNQIDDTPDVVNYIRGVDQFGYRKRSATFREGESARPWLLGDVITSSPLIDAGSLSSPRYDIIYNDETYSAFLDRYNKARHMVYFGANDGLLRGVNGGFFDQDNQAFVRSLNGETAHPLGSEMWAYVPKSVLPHLQWLRELDYKHNYYVDGIGQVHTVNIFQGKDPNIYPNGWGKILVMGTGLGGGRFEIDTNSDGTKDRITYPSFVILDITDVESPPKLLAEISHPELGFSTSRPTLAFFRQRGIDGTYANPKRNDWYLMFGSGPNGTDAQTYTLAARQGVSNKSAKIFVYDLKRQQYVNFDSTGYFDVTTQPRSFIGGLTAVDWDKEDGYGTDAVYFGSVRDDSTKSWGDMLRFIPGENGDMVNPKINRLLVNSEGKSLRRAVQGVPAVVNRLGEQWVYFGTGRFIGEDDSKGENQMGFYAVREFPTTGRYLQSEYRLSNLINAKGFNVEFDENNSGGDLVNNSGRPVTGSARAFRGGNALANQARSEQATVEDLRDYVSINQGWYREFDNLADRQVGLVGHDNDSVFYTVYTANGDDCNPLGSTKIYGVGYNVGVTPAYSILGETEFKNGVEVASPDSFFSEGLVRDATILTGVRFLPSFDTQDISSLEIDDNGELRDPNANMGNNGNNNSSGGNGNNNGGGNGSSGGNNGNGGSSGSSNGSGGNSNSSSSANVTCESIGSLIGNTANSSITKIDVRNCRRNSGRLSWREIDIPW